MSIIHNKGKVIISRILLICYISSNFNPLFQEIFHAASHVLSNGSYHFHSHSNENPTEHHHGLSTALLDQNIDSPVSDIIVPAGNLSYPTVQYLDYQYMSLTEASDIKTAPYPKNMGLPKSIYTKLTVPPPK